MSERERVAEDGSVGEMTGADIETGENAAQPSPESRLVLCAANAYEEKYWFNPLFDRIPDSIKEELRIICILFTQDAGGVFAIVFDEEGQIELDAYADEEDITYDQVSAGLLRGEVRRRRADVFRMLELYYRICVLKENAADVLMEMDEGDGREDAAS